MTSFGLHGELFADDEMRAIFSDVAMLQRMLDFEAALAAAEAAEGVIPAAAVEPITAACRADLYDIAAIGREATAGGNPAIPLVKALTAEVAKTDPEAAKWVHWGATSQDVIDSAAMAGYVRAAGVVAGRLGRIVRALAGAAEKHRRTVMPGRTLLQQAVPVTFGGKVAAWIPPLVESRRALARAATPRVQFGGAAGTLASLGAAGPRVAARLAAAVASDRLAPWHTDRRPVARLASELGLLLASLGKIARDVSLLMQTEVAEVFEPAAAGRGGSSTMPHKRNPVFCAAILAAATRAPGLVATMLTAAVQEHERAVGGWHAEWEVLPELFMLAGAAARHAEIMIGGLEVDGERMRANLEATRGLVMSERVSFALADAVGRDAAKAIVEAACKRAVAERAHLRDVLVADPAVRAVLDEPAIDALFDPTTYLGATDVFIDDALAWVEDDL